MGRKAQEGAVSDKNFYFPQAQLFLHAEKQPGIFRVGEVLLKRGHIHIVSSRGATMVGAEGKIVEIWTLQIALKWPSRALTEAYFKEK